MLSLLIVQTLDGIVSTGLFEDVRLVPSERLGDAGPESDETALDVTLVLREKEKMRHITGGVGVSTVCSSAQPASLWVTQAYLCQPIGMPLFLFF